MAIPMFSIVIPTFNRRDLVGAAIDSVLAQDFDGGFEILIGDDGSTDGTPDFIEETYGDRVQVYRQANAGPGPARNLAIKHACGEYLAFLDSDDAFLPWTLSEYSELICQHNRPSILIGNGYETDDLLSEMGRVRDASESRVYPNLYESRMAAKLIATDRLTVRREVFEQIGDFTGVVNNGEDIDFLARAGLAQGYVVIDSPYTFIRRAHTQQVSKEPDGAYKGRMFLLDQEDRGVYPGGRKYRKHRRELLSFWARIASMQMLRMGRPDLGMHFYRRVFWWNVQLLRIRFLMGYPILCLKKRV